MSLVATLLPPLGALPTELVNLPHWLGWRAQVRAGKRTKVPISPRTGRLASSTDPATWTTFDVAASFAEQSHCDGVGFVFTHSPYVGIDLDHCIDPRSGELEAWAMAIVERFASYTEISPSGTGLHIIVKGELPEGRKKKHVDGGHPNAAIEVYDTGRYFTITGRHLGGIPFDIVEASDLAAWHAETFPAPPPEERERTEPASTPIGVDDAELIRLASNAKGEAGARFARLWSGDTSEYDGDDSRADLALCNALAFWTNRDGARMDHLFRQSGLMRKKWDGRRGKETYGQLTIQRAIRDTSEGYSGPALEVDLSTPVPQSADGSSKRARPRAQIIDAPTLMGRPQTIPRYAVPGILPEGLSILAGRPKMGKSWLALGMALAISRGAPAFGMVEVEQGEVLYLALEDGERRLQRRLGELLNDEPPPPLLTFATEWPPLDKGGLADLDAWLAGRRGARFVCIDTFKRVRPEEKRGASIYGQDYDAVFPVADLAHKHSTSIVIVMHTRKMESEDPLDLISGSLGLSGAADGALIMRRARGSQDALLNVISRDDEDKELALRWDLGIGGWVLLGDSAEYRRSTQRNEVLQAIHLTGSATPKEIADRLGKAPATVRRLLWSMVQDRLVSNAGGTYFPIAERPGDAVHDR